MNRVRVFFHAGVWCCTDGHVMATGPTKQEAWRLFRAIKRINP